MTPHPADWPLPDFRLRHCPECAGDGYVDERDYLTADDLLPIGHVAHRIDCPFCGGSGFDPDPAPTTTRKAQS